MYLHDAEELPLFILTLVHLDPLQKELKRLFRAMNNNLLQKVFKELIDLIFV